MQMRMNPKTIYVLFSGLDTSGGKKLDKEAFLAATLT